MENINIKLIKSIKAIKKPIEVQASLFEIQSEDIANLNTVKIFDIIYPVYKDHIGYYINIKTLHGIVRCDNKTYVIKSPQGDVYPHAYNEFHANYNV